MKEFYYILQKPFFEFLKNLLFCVCDGCLNLTVFNCFFQEFFYWEHEVFEKKTVKFKQPSRTQNNRFFKNSKKWVLQLILMLLHARKLRI